MGLRILVDWISIVNSLGNPMKIQYDELMAAVESDECLGFCLACGDQAFGVEPDARKYECESCGAHQVYGAQEILMMDAIDYETPPE
jgi:hypothetical protein